MGTGFFKSSLLGDRVAVNLVVTLISIAATFFAFIFTESLSLTSILPVRMSSHLKKQWVTKLAILGVIAVSILLLYLMFEGMKPLSPELNTLSGGALESGVSAMDWLAFSMVGVYPFLLVSIPFSFHYLARLIKRDCLHQEKSERRCLYGFISLFFIVPLLWYVAVSTFHLFSLPFSDLVLVRWDWLGYDPGKAAAIFYIMVFAGVGVFFTHNFSLRALRKMDISSAMILAIGALYLLLLVDANLLYQERDRILATMADLSALLSGQGEGPREALTRTPMDRIVLFVIANFYFLSLLLGGVVTRTMRCLILGGWLSERGRQ